MEVRRGCGHGGGGHGEAADDGDDAIPLIRQPPQKDPHADDHDDAGLLAAQQQQREVPQDFHGRLVREEGCSDEDRERTNGCCGTMPPAPHVRRNKRGIMLAWVLAIVSAALAAMFRIARRNQGVKLQRVQLKVMHQHFVAAKRDLFDRMERDYGVDTANRMFLLSNETTRGRLLFGNGELGWNGLKRKLTLKLLQVLMASSRNRNGRNHGIVPFVWVTGGNSVAAGHGNLFNESYTAVLDRAVAPLFRALEMTFEGRNYGMSAAWSGPEIALCLESKYGTDVDLLVWDFSLTDMREYQHFELFHHRASLMRSRPVALALPRGRSLAISDDFRDDALDVLHSVAATGLSALYMNESQLADALLHVPDTWGMNQTEIDLMPRNVKNFKCQDRLEIGDPYCGASKFNSDVCPVREWQVSWHPGWKWNAVHGYGMALFLMEALQEALADLTYVLNNSTLVSSDDDVRLLEDRLRQEESTAYDHVSQGPSLPEYSVRFHGNESFANYLRSLYYTRPNYCHTAALPSEIRYRGILTNQMDDPPDRESFELVGPSCITTGISADLISVVEDDDAMRLICNSRFRQVSCNVTLNIDHRDYFYVGYPESTLQGRWKQLTLPTDAELAFYGTELPGQSDGDELEGVIAFCSSDCGGNDCPDADVHFDDNTSALGSAVEMRVNGASVVGLARLSRPGQRGGSCHVLLRNESGGVHWDADKSGKYRIQVRVLAKDHYVRFSSFILF